MADEIRRIDYYYVSVPDKPGEAARILSALHPAGINLLGVSAFPHGARRSQLDFIPEDSAAFAKAAKSAGLKLSKKKSGFLIQGDDRPGAIAEITSKLADAKVNITSCNVLHRLRSLRRDALGQADELSQSSQSPRHRLDLTRQICQVGCPQ